ncbi:MAG: sigma-54 dependent transcriptional regulator [Candidatus Aminicenantes bacterium]|nr:sigma-54 dependent transcriptional regulator [Candidatus Aminicenantes bacterium]
MGQELYPDFSILLVDDEEDFLNSMNVAFKRNGINNIECCRDSLQVMPLLKKKDISLILLDIRMPGISGDKLLPQIIEEYPGVSIIMLTSSGGIETVVECMKKGALDYIVKPPDMSKLIKTVQNTIQLIAVKRENARLKEACFSEEPKELKYFDHIVTRDKMMLKIFKYIESIAQSPEPVLVTGETGVGKELIARAIHKASERPGKFVAENVAGLDDTLFTDTLFGHKKGAFNDAYQDRDGLIEEARNGSLLLDEIGDLTPESQVKLLRLLQEKEFRPLGVDKPKKSYARMVVATNRDLNRLMEEGKFRKDLYHRLESHKIHIPPLRERKEDIPRLVEHFIEKASDTLNKKIIHIPEVLYTLLYNYHFPGNVRELETMIMDAVSRSQEGTLSIAPFYEKIGKSIEIFKLTPATKIEPVTVGEGIAFGENFPTYRDMKKLYLEEALKRAGGNQTRAAELAGLFRTTFLNKLKRVTDPFSTED